LTSANEFIGEQLVDLLLKRAEGRSKGAPEHRMIEPLLVVPSLKAANA